MNRLGRTVLTIRETVSSHIGDMSTCFYVKITMSLEGLGHTFPTGKDEILKEACGFEVTS